MSNKKINELASAASLSLTDLLVIGEPSSGFAYKTTLNDFKTWLGVQNIYTNDGTITGNRIVTISGTNTLTFAGSTSATQFIVNTRTQFNGSLSLYDNLSFVGTTSASKTIYANELTFTTNNAPSYTSNQTKFTITTELPTINSGALTSTLLKLLMPVNTGTQAGNSKALVIDFNVTSNAGVLTALETVQGNVLLNSTSGSTYVGYSSAPSEGYKFQVLGASNVVYIKGSGTGTYLAVYDSATTPNSFFRVLSDGRMLVDTTNVTHRIGNLLFTGSVITGYSSITIGTDNGPDNVVFATKDIYFGGPRTGFGFLPANFISSAQPSNGTLEGIIIQNNFTNSGAGLTSVYNSFFSKVKAETAVGNVIINHFGVSSVFNTTGGITLSRGFYYNATSSGSVGLSHIAFENVVGNNYFNSSSGSTLIGYASGTAPTYKLDVNGTSRFGSTLKIDAPAGYGVDILTTTINGGTSAFKINQYGIVYITNAGTNATAAYVGEILGLGQKIDSLMLYSQLNNSGITQWTGTYDSTLFKVQNNHTVSSGWFFIVDNGNAGSFSDLTFGGTAGSGMQQDRNLLSLRHAVNSGTYTFGSTPGSQTYTLLNIPIAVAPTGTGKILRGIKYAPTISGTALTSHYAATFASGQIGVGTETPHASALVELASTTQGFLPPRLTATEANTLAAGSVANGLLIYVTNNGGSVPFTTEGWWGKTSGGWVRLN